MDISLPSARAQLQGKPLTTASICKQTSITRGALRVYEREGVIEPPRRTGAGYRDYPADTIDRIEAIRQLKEIGFSLREIALLLSERDTGHIDARELQRMAREQVHAIDARIARLQVVRTYVDQVAQGNAGLIDDPACAFLFRFLSAGKPKP
ncbi:MAG: MerR family transcriptional regulator [Haliea sp.]|nr:MAG: MerR family transcriptional regulator [Haliea sp.]